MNVNFNINEKVKIKLTEMGKQILQEQGRKFTIDEEGYTTFQLWDLMSIFGEDIYMGMRLPHIPFEPNIILLDAEEISE